MNISGQIEDFKNGELVQIFRKWQSYVINPYTLAYQRAFDSFQKTLDTQKAFDKMQMELVFTALSLFGGSIFTTAFGAITAKKLAGDVTLDFICKYNMERAFKVAGFVSENKTAEFIVGAVWDKSTSALNDKIKTSFQENAANFPAIETIVKKPYEIEKALEQFRLNCEIALYEALKAILNIGDDSVKSNFFELIKKSPYCSPPSKKYYPENFEDHLELGFYMQYVLDTDHLVSGVFVSSMHGSGYARTGSKAIAATPDQKTYPTGTSKSLGFGTTEFTSVEYDRIGQDIIDRINVLYKKHYKTDKPFIDSNWFGEQADKNTLFKATQVLNDLANANATIIQQQSAAK